MGVHMKPISQFPKKLLDYALGLLAFFVVNALGGVGWLAWGLRGLRESEAMDRQWKVQDVRWRAQDRAWRERWPERTRHLEDG